MSESQDIRSEEQRDVELSENKCGELHQEEWVSKDRLLLGQKSSCSRCVELQQRIDVLQKELKKLEGILKKNVNQSDQSFPEKFRFYTEVEASSTSRSKTPKNNQNMSFSFDSFEIEWEAQKKLLRSLEQKAEKLCQKERKERKILKQLITSRESLSPSRKTIEESDKKQGQGEIESEKMVMVPVQKLVSEQRVEILIQQPQKVEIAQARMIESQEFKGTKISEQIEIKPQLIQKAKVEQIKSQKAPEKQQYQEQIISSESSPIKEIVQPPLYSSSIGFGQPDQLDNKINQMLSSSEVSYNQQTVNQISELQSERKSKLQNMTNQQRDVYYSKQLNNRKMMAKLKKKKK